jgi:hypothetical protein
LALIASAKARDIYSTSEEGRAGYWFALEEDRDRPGVGMPLALPGVGIPDWRALLGVVDILRSRRVLTLQRDWWHQDL